MNSTPTPVHFLIHFPADFRIADYVIYNAKNQPRSVGSAGVPTLAELVGQPSGVYGDQYRQFVVNIQSDERHTIRLLPLQDAPSPKPTIRQLFIIGERTETTQRLLYSIVIHQNATSVDFTISINPSGSSALFNVEYQVLPPLPASPRMPFDSLYMNVDDSNFDYSYSFELAHWPKKKATELHPGDFPVWFATNRERVFSDAGKLIDFSSDLAADEAVYYGKCVVHIPEGHVTGQIESAFWRRLLRRLTFREDDQKLYIVSLEEQASAEYWDDIAARAEEWAADERCGLVFLHGYNVAFQEAAIRAAQIGYDLKIRGPVGFFSWPSLGTLQGYLADVDAVEASAPAITQYLQDFVNRSGVQRVFIIAHSMGNRGLLHALEGLATTTPLFEHIVLAAPDVHQAIFKANAAQYKRVARKTTLYVSDKDLALKVSAFVRDRRPRVGFTPPVTIVPDIDTIEVGRIDLTRLGHGYVAEVGNVIEDMDQLLHRNLAPDKRDRMHPATYVHPRSKKEQDYWVLQPKP